MDTLGIGPSIRRAQAVFLHKPGLAVHDDAPATARWDGGARVLTRHDSGAQFATDLPQELGGQGQDVTPGWMYRAGLAACAATSVVMAAEAQGLVLTSLEVRATSRSDARGLLGMSDAAGQPYPAAPLAVGLWVRIAADGVAEQDLRALVAQALSHSPVPCLTTEVVPLSIAVDWVSAG